MQSPNLPSVSLTSSFVLFSYLRPGFGLPIVPLFKASRIKFLSTDAHSVLYKSLVLHFVVSKPLKSTSTTSIHVNLRLPGCLPAISLSSHIQMPVPDIWRFKFTTTPFIHFSPVTISKCRPIQFSEDFPFQSHLGSFHFTRFGPRFSTKGHNLYYFFFFTQTDSY